MNTDRVLTAADIDAIPAGRELDAMIAESFFDWERCPCANPECDFWVTPIAQGGEWDASLPYYSTDIADAWLLVEKMQKRDDDKFYNALADQTPLIALTGSQAALTISRAALKAILHK